MDIVNNIYKYVNMYELPTVYGNDFIESVVLPTNMYEMPIVYDYNNDDKLQSTQTNGQINDVLVDGIFFKGVDKCLALEPLKDLLSRQELLLKRLEALEKGLDSLSRPAISEEHKLTTSSPNKCPNRLTTSSSVGCSDEVLNSLKDIVIVCDGKQIPLSVLAVIKLMRNLGLKVLIKHHFHSSLTIKKEVVFDEFNKSFSLIGLNEKSVGSGIEGRLSNDLIVTFIFKNVSTLHMILSPNDLTAIESEANIIRFMVRFAAKLRPELSYIYEGIDDISRLTAIDNFVDEINAKIFVNFQEKYILELDSHLSSNRYLYGKSPTIADLLLWSSLNQRISAKLSPNMKKWLDSIKQFISNPNETL